MLNRLLTTTIIVGTIAVAPIAFAQTTATTTTVTSGAAVDAASSRTTALNFITYVNNARYALVSKNTSSAANYIKAASDMAAKLETYTAEQRRVSRVQSGRVVYDTQTRYNYQYYPVQTGLTTMKEVDSGPFWSREKGLAVKDAEFVYLTVDLSNAKVQQELTKAQEQINKGDLKDADDILGDLIDDVVKVDEKEAAAGIKARDNMELARYYISAKNYDAARYPLKHAKSALKDMEGDSRYSANQARIRTMLTEVEALENTIAKNDPTATEKAAKKVEIWWTDLKSWVSDKTN